MSLRPSIQPGLLAVDTLRKEAVKQAQGELARAREALSDAEAAVLVARAELARHTPEPPPAGRMTGAELQRAGAYRERQEEELLRLEQRLARREGTLAGARSRVDRAREALRQAHVAAQLVGRHLDRRRQDQRRHAERRAEDELDDDHHVV